MLCPWQAPNGRNALLHAEHFKSHLHPSSCFPTSTSQAPCLCQCLSFVRRSCRPQAVSNWPCLQTSLSCMLPGQLPEDLDLTLMTCCLSSHTNLQQTAKMNYRTQAKDGLPPNLFRDLPVITGHYHLPHSVPNSNILYIGSPYQGWQTALLPSEPQQLC